MKYHFLILISLLILSGEVLSAGKHQNIARKNKLTQEIIELVDQIPIYRGRLEGEYAIIGKVIGQDIFSRKIDGIARQVRVQAYEMGADAIIEFQCDDHLKSTMRNCQGMAIKFPKGNH